jgi:hypothetical protein
MVFRPIFHSAVNKAQLSEDAALDEEGIVVPGSYVAWTSVRTIASMEWIVGGESAPTFQRHIVLYRRRERPLRIVLPEMDDAEREQLWVIVSAIAARYRIEIVSDETEAGRAWLRRRQLFEEYL